MQRIAEHPDLIIHNAHAHTLDPAIPRAQAVAVRRHRIMAVGNDGGVLSLAGPGTRRVDAGGALLLPGLCDAHIHFGKWAIMQGEIPIADTRSLGELLERVAARAASTPQGDWLIARGWNESRWGTTDFPTAADLDPVTGPDRPTLLWRADMHAAVANSSALRLAGIDAATVDPPAGVIDRDGSGAPTGVLREAATNLVNRHVPPPTPAEFDGLLRAGTAILHRLGVTAIHDQRVWAQDDGPRNLAAFQRLRAAGELRLRVACNVAAHDLEHVAALGLRSGFGDDFLRLGHVKLFADGSLGSRTAWMLAPFAKRDPAEPDNVGVVVTPPDEMAAVLRRALELGFPVSIHAIGDRANRVVLDVFEELADGGPVPPAPHRIEHVQTIHPADVGRLARLNITASVQPIHALDDMDTAALLLGERQAHTYAFRALLDAGTRLAFGSDAPVADPNPFLGLHAAVARQRVERMGRGPWHGEQRITLAEAIRAYTLGAAEAAGWQGRIGAIRAGLRADLALLDRDLFAAEARGVTGDEVAGTQVRMTVFNGDIVYEA